MDTAKWIHEAKCDTNLNTLCGATTCIKGIGAKCPANEVIVTTLTDPSANLNSMITDDGNKDVSGESTIIIRKAGKNPTTNVATPAI